MGRCLLAGSTHDLAAAFRVCQIWFSHSQEEGVNAALAAMAAQVPSHKFLCLVYQIASRLGAPGSRFQVGWTPFPRPASSVCHADCVHAAHALLLW